MWKMCFLEKFLGTFWNFSSSKVVSRKLELFGTKE